MVGERPQGHVRPAVDVGCPCQPFVKACDIATHGANEVLGVVALDVLQLDYILNRVM